MCGAWYARVGESEDELVPVGKFSPPGRLSASEEQVGTVVGFKSATPGAVLLYMPRKIYVGTSEGEQRCWVEILGDCRQNLAGDFQKKAMLGRFRFRF